MTLLSEMMADHGPTLQGKGANDEAAYSIIARLADAEATIIEVKDWMRAIEATQPNLLEGLMSGQAPPAAPNAGTPGQVTGIQIHPGATPI